MFVKLTSVGNLLILVGGLHFILGIMVPPYQIGSLEILQGNFFNTVDRTALMTSLAFWYHVAGGAYCLLGLLCNRYERDAGKPTPAAFGWALLALSVVAVIMAPRGGFWGGIVIAGIVLFRARDPVGTR